MKHLINPLVDCVFKAILGSESNKPVLISFLNSVIKPACPIVSVEILNPYNEKEFVGDKLSIVDIKAKDELHRLYQIEVQLALFPHLPARMLYTWSDIYSAQLQGGDNYNALNPVISVWMLAGKLFPETPVAHHCFQIADIRQQKVLIDHCAMHILELEKWQAAETLTAEDQWMLFFREARHWAELPEHLNLPELKQAMATLQRFSEKERDYHLYQARQNAIREQSAQQEYWQAQQEALEEALRKQEEALRKQEEAIRQREEERIAKEEAQRKQEEAQRKQEEAITELERLKALLKQSGIDPDA